MIVMNSKFLSYMWEMGVWKRWWDPRIESCQLQQRPRARAARASCVPCLPFGFFHFPRALVLSLSLHSFLSFPRHPPCRILTLRARLTISLVPTTVWARRSERARLVSSLKVGPLLLLLHSLHLTTLPGPSRDRVIEWMKWIYSDLLFLSLFLPSYLSLSLAHSLALLCVVPSSWCRTLSRSQLAQFANRCHQVCTSFLFYYLRSLSSHYHCVGCYFWYLKSTYILDACRC